MDEKLEFDTPHVGEVYTIVHCLKAEKSFRKAIERVSPAGKRKKFERAIVQQMKRLASGQKMSKANFPKEGRLPNLVGKTGNDHFYAFKRIPIRAYCWESKAHPNTYYISHYIYKDFDALDDTDTDKVINNWRRIEENGDER